MLNVLNCLIVFALLFKQYYKLLEVKIIENIAGVFLRSLNTNSMAVTNFKMATPIWRPHRPTIGTHKSDEYQEGGFGIADYYTESDIKTTEFKISDPIWQWHIDPANAKWAETVGSAWNMVFQIFRDTLIMNPNWVLQQDDASNMGPNPALHTRCSRYIVPAISSFVISTSGWRSTNPETRLVNHV